MENNKYFYEFLRTNKGLRGVVCAIGPGVYGWTLCKKIDRFNKSFGVETALKRAEKLKSFISEGNEEKITKYKESTPRSLKELVEKISERSKLYFK